jgi:hypothetical protein
LHVEAKVDLEKEDLEEDLEEELGPAVPTLLLLAAPVDAALPAGQTQRPLAPISAGTAPADEQAMHVVLDLLLVHLTQAGSPDLEAHALLPPLGVEMAAVLLLPLLLLRTLCVTPVRWESRVARETKRNDRGD